MKFRASSCAVQSAKSPPSQGAWIEIEKVVGAAVAAAGRPLRRGRGLKFIDEVMLLCDSRESPPSQGAWIEIFFRVRNARICAMSPPSQGAWIEIENVSSTIFQGQSRPLRRGRGLKWLLHAAARSAGSRPLRRGRGLKSESEACCDHGKRGRPLRRGRGLKYSVP